MERAEKHAESLLHVLREELRLTGELIWFAREKARLISGADAKGLNDLLAIEEETVIALREKEEERIGSAKELAAALDACPDGLTIRELAERTRDPELSRRLIGAGNDMVLKMRELSRHNEKVKKLLNHQVSYTNFMLNLLFSSKKQALFYNGQGNRENQENIVSRLNYQA